MKTTSIIKQNLYYKVCQWCKLNCDTIPEIPSDATGDLLCTMVEYQAEIGWDNFVKGRVSKHWSFAQDCYNMAIPNNKSGAATTWTTSLIMAVWTIFADIWNA
eukprot:15357090-Ditylum_brightwellii.AAC.1